MPKLGETPDIVAPDVKHIWTVILTTYCYVIAFVPHVGPSFIPREGAIGVAILLFIAHFLEALYAMKVAKNADFVKPVHVFYWGLQTWMWGFPSLLKLKEVTKEEVKASRKKKDM